jgi:hypothetical protein
MQVSHSGGKRDKPEGDMEGKSPQVKNKKRKKQAIDQRVLCTLCDILCQDTQAYEAHNEGKKHKAAAALAVKRSAQLPFPEEGSAQLAPLRMSSNEHLSALVDAQLPFRGLGAIVVAGLLLSEPEANALIEAAPYQRRDAVIDALFLIATANATTPALSEDQVKALLSYIITAHCTALARDRTSVAAVAPFHFAQAAIANLPLEYLIKLARDKRAARQAFSIHINDIFGPMAGIEWGALSFTSTLDANRLLDEALVPMRHRLTQGGPRHRRRHSDPTAGPLTSLSALTPFSVSLLPEHPTPSSVPSSWPPRGDPLSPSRLGAFAPTDPESTTVALQLAELDPSWPHLSAPRMEEEEEEVEVEEEEEAFSGGEEEDEEFSDDYGDDYGDDYD